jgi:putative ABC transport system substrate-binding protein
MSPMMQRREFITLLGGVAAWPLAARAQQPGRLVRIGFLSGGAGPNPNVYGFQHGLRQLGYVEGQNLVLIYRWAAAQRIDQTTSGFEHRAFGEAAACYPAKIEF